MKCRGLQTLHVLLCMALLLFVASPARSAGVEGSTGTAAAAVQPLPWSGLSPAQQQLLDKQRGKWDTLPANRQHALARGAERWLSMDDSARQAAQDRFQRFDTMPLKRKELLRRRWLQFQSLDPQTQAKIRENFRAFRALPQTEREALRRQWQTADRAQRLQMLQQLREQRARQRGAQQQQPSGTTR